MQPFWSITTGSEGGSKSFPSRPLVTETNTLARAWSAPSTSVSGLTAPLCFASHLGSAPILSGGKFGTRPSYVILPTIVPPKAIEDEARAMARRTAQTRIVCLEIMSMLLEGRWC